MACRIGITTDPRGCKANWGKKYKDMRDWQILAGPFDSMAEAQAEEDRLARKYDCQRHGAGRDPDSTDGNWYVYGFNYGSVE